MLRSHSRANDVGVGVKSVAYWSTRASGTLLLFVHGFGDGAVKCWKDFPSLLLAERKAAGADLVFFGYDSLFSQVGANAQELYKLLDLLITAPSSFINPLVDPSEARPPSFAYTRVVIVAHSLGAVITRKALLSAHGKNCTWQGRCTLVLFAPAHMGARSPKLALGGVALVPAIGGVLSGLAQHFIPALDDLVPGSPVLAQLLDDSKKLLAVGGADHLKAKVVVFGAKERVVLTTRFGEDPDPPEWVPKKGHTDIQQPTTSFRLPLDRVLALL
ncbi:MAG: hypothetical protein U0527_04270 [Candidatus Eisenbacteria bacterium]